LAQTTATDFAKTVFKPTPTITSSLVTPTSTTVPLVLKPRTTTKLPKTTDTKSSLITGYTIKTKPSLSKGRVETGLVDKALGQRSEKLSFQITKQLQINKQPQDLRQRQFQSVTQAQSNKQVQSTRQTQSTKQAQATQQEQMLKQTQITKQVSLTSPTPIIVPPVPTPTPFFATFPIPTNKSKSLRSPFKISLSQPKKYTPTFTAGAYGIFGKSTKGGVRSGLGIRPVQGKKRLILPDLKKKL